MIETIEQLREYLQDKIEEHKEESNKPHIDLKVADHVFHRNQVARIGAITALEMLLEEVGE